MERGHRARESKSQNKPGASAGNSAGASCAGTSNGDISGASIGATGGSVSGGNSIGFCGAGASAGAACADDYVDAFGAGVLSVLQVLVPEKVVPLLVLRAPPV